MLFHAHEEVVARNIGAPAITEQPEGRYARIDDYQELASVCQRVIDAFEKLGRSPGQLALYARMEAERALVALKAALNQQEKV